MEIDRSGSSEILNELFVKVHDSLPSDLQRSIFYSRLRNRTHREIMIFTREQVGLKNDLIKLKAKIGSSMSEKDIINLFEPLLAKYNNIDNSVGLVYHIEATRIDYGVSLVAIVKRENISVKKFVFRFRRKSKEIKRGTGN